jgi:hypothetical protein
MSTGGLLAGASVPRTPGIISVLVTVLGASSEVDMLGFGCSVIVMMRGDPSGPVMVVMMRGNWPGIDTVKVDADAWVFVVG